MKAMGGAAPAERGEGGRSWGRSETNTCTFSYCHCERLESSLSGPGDECLYACGAPGPRAPVSAGAVKRLCKETIDCEARKNRRLKSERLRAERGGRKGGRGDRATFIGRKILTFNNRKR